MIKQIQKYVYDLCHRKDFQDSDWYWEEHLEEVERLCELFGQKLLADMEILMPSALLHDIGKILGLKNHAETGAMEAEKYLANINYPKTKIKPIVDCIREHYSEKPEPVSLESKILASCDGASHFTTLFWERYFYDVARGLFPERGDDWEEAVKSNAQKAKEHWEKIVIPEIKEYAKNDYESFLRRYKLRK